MTDNQPLLWTGPRRGCTLFYSLAHPARRVAGHRASSVMSHEAIRLGGATDFVEVCLVEVGDPGTPAVGDVRLGVSVVMGSFSGSYDQVWIAADQWQAFLASLNRLERERHGQAAVESMSPDEFTLRFQITNAAGRLSAFGVLSKYHLGHPSGHTSRSRIEYHFELDPSMLRLWVEAFTSLGSPDV